MSGKFAENRKAYFNYEILEKITAGIQLLGYEVKAVRAGRMTMDGAYTVVRGGEAFLIIQPLLYFNPKMLQKIMMKEETANCYLPKKKSLIWLEKKSRMG
ncbi:MAG: SsrA-binding protein [Candidatus Paceibacterota bacterium]|jgi:tmRNA-binding protein